MTFTSSKASAPGTVMLFGEHAVLRDKLALVGAVNKRISVSIVTRRDDKLIILSELGRYQTPLKNPKPHSLFQYILTSLNRSNLGKITGLEVTIYSEFTSTVGLGSSAAVTVAFISALRQLQGIETSKLELFREAQSVIQLVQGAGSGADVAASVFGGIIAFQKNPLSIVKLPHLFDISLIYSGQKEPTSKVIALVNQYAQRHPEHYQVIFHEIDNISQQAYLAIRQKDWYRLAQCMHQQQHLMKRMGVSNMLLNELVLSLEQQTDVFAAKISGSGLGDCVLALGHCPFGTFPETAQQQEHGVKQLTASLSPQGVSFASA